MTQGSVHGMVHSAANERADQWLNAAKVDELLSKTIDHDAGRIRAILDKARAMEGLDAEEVSVLCHISAPDELEALYETARTVKEEIYGSRIVLFAPLYISSVCANDCSYCAFRSTNKALARTALNQDDIRRETEELIEQGHKRLLLVAGESYPASRGGFQYVLDAIATVYSVGDKGASIRRLNANLAPLSIEEFALLKEAEIGTYQLFQETYHRETYSSVHLSGKKSHFDWRCSALDRAMEAGIDDVGMGVLLGLHDWKFEILSLMQHINHLEERFGVGCHTISVPRMEPAAGSELSIAPPAPVSDSDFKKIIAIMRLAVPYTGLILSTRESAAIRRDCYALGVSQISAGSRTDPGGYASKGTTGQFQLGDHRSLEEVVHELSTMGFVPSFCTACYRMGRTGQDFMDLAKPGLIKERCDPNSVTTFQEYLIDFASDKVRAQGEVTIGCALEKMSERTRRAAEKMVNKTRNGKRDVYA